MAVIVGIAIFCFIVAMLFYLADYVAFHKNNQDSENGLKNFGDCKTAKEIGLKIITIFLFFSIALAIISFLLTNHWVSSYGQKIIKVIMVLVDFGLTYTVVGYLCNIFRIERSGDVAMGWFVQIITALLITLAWVFYPNWLTLDIAAFMLALMFLIAFKNISFKQALAFSVAIMAYDMFMVFGTGVMQKVASAGVKINIPILIVVPDSLSLSANKLFMIGLGDIVLPGLLIMLAFRFARQYHWSTTGLIIRLCAITGYIIGFFMAIIMAVMFNFGQPATIYLIPGVMLGILATVIYKKLLKELWNF